MWVLLIQRLHNVEYDGTSDSRRALYVRRIFLLRAVRSDSLAGVRKASEHVLHQLADLLRHAWIVYHFRFFCSQSFGQLPIVSELPTEPPAVFCIDVRQSVTDES